jgi:predicted  nucleic acid-binding Zn-ribbon protein
MSRRAKAPGLEFGSDSFLDVVCNIVGILIILIVIVAVKVQRQPERSESQKDAVANAESLSARQLAELEGRQSTLGKLNDMLSQLQQQLQVAHAQHQRDTNLLQQIAESRSEAERQLESVTQQKTRQQRQATEADAERQMVSLRIAALKKSLTETESQTADAGQALTVVSSSADELTESLQTTVVETQKLQEVLQTAQLSSMPTNRLQHRLAPVTRAVESDEVHFRVSRNRISAIPLEQLLERWKSQVLSRRSVMMRLNQFEGRVGPVNGYYLDYVVEKEGPSTLEALRNGETTTRVNMSRWTITVDPDAPEESIEEAVRPGSLFRQSIEAVPPDSVITIWIYSDSFSSFPALREVAHGLQLRVAARPLPEGTPIVGSPNGSRSTAQ